MAKTKRIGFQAIYDLAKGRESLKPLAEEIARDFSVSGGGSSETGIILNGNKVNSISLQGGTVSFDTINHSANILIPESPLPKHSANFTVTPKTLTFSTSTNPETVTLNHNGDGVIDWIFFGENVTVEQIKSNQYLIRPLISGYREESELFFRLSETENYYPAATTCKIINNVNPNYITLNFNNPENYFYNSGIGNIKAKIEEEVAGDITLTNSDVYEGEYSLSIAKTDYKDNVTLFQELGGQSFTIRFAQKLLSGNSNGECGILRPNKNLEEKLLGFYFGGGYLNALNSIKGTPSETRLSRSNNWQDFRICYDHELKEIYLIQAGTIRKTITETDLPEADSMLSFSCKQLLDNLEVINGYCVK